MKLTVSKDSQWEPETYAKAPLELLLCEDIHPNSKLLWIILANQSRFGSIDKSVLDKMIGIHRSTRIRCIKELRDIGLIKGKDDSNLVMVNPGPILRKLIETSTQARIEAQQQIFNIIEGAGQSIDGETVKPEKPNFLEEARTAWNSYRPANYSKVNRMSSEMLKAIDSHISSLKLKPHCYEYFFSVLKVGVEHSQFWSKDNSSKNLQSITGLGTPQAKKYQNVYTLFNEGLNYDRAEAIEESQRRDHVTISSKYRPLIDQYDELQFMYYELSKNDPDSLDMLSGRIIETEQKMREAKLDPARFRMKYQMASWPSDVPEPEFSRETFWKYDDEK